MPTVSSRNNALEDRMIPSAQKHKSAVDLSTTVGEMESAATVFLNSLEPLQLRKCSFPIDSEERFNWDYRPVPRSGLPLAEIDSAQQRRALVLLASGLSREGNITALNIMSLETILGKLEEGYGRHIRDPERYFVSVFGQPGFGDFWGWRFEGHHLPVNFLISSDGRISCCPQFFGANPARVPTHPYKGFATLPHEEEKARALLHSLDHAQLAQVLVGPEAPNDIITGWAAHIRLDEPVGLAVTNLKEQQRAMLIDLLGVYSKRMAPRIADTELELLDREGFGNIYFAWAGSSKPGESHYYRLHGPSVVIEYDNVQNNSNHIHSVWRNLRRDWGKDLLRDHYARSHKST